VFKFQQEVGGELRGGDPGVHLQAHPDALETPAHYSPAAATQAQSDEGFHLLAAPVLFGGEELSAYSPAIEQRMQPAFIVVHPDDAARLGVSEGDGLIAANHSLEVRTNPAMTLGMAAIPVGSPNAPSWLPQHRVELTRDENFVKRPTIIARG
jgi:NADH-quinone oxidoreductase subunit G